MTIRPSELRRQGRNAPREVLHCGECVADYPADARGFEWARELEPLRCEACGSELVLETLTVVGG